MAIVTGPFSQVRFMGASVTGFSSSVGWNEQQSTLVVQLVEDIQNGDQFTPLPVGKPAKFVFDKFVFEGLVQRSNQEGTMSGNPTYEVMLVDPRQILGGAQVIIASFTGAVSKVPNLLNAYGYWEAIMGFGGALVNESGMIWNSLYSNIKFSDVGLNTIVTDVVTPSAAIGIKPAVEALTKKGNDFGGPLQFRGEFYNVDLSALPVPPSYYRIGGVSVSILDAISQICQDGGHDFMIILEDHTIKVKTVSRVFQPHIGDIANFVNSQTNVTSKSIGTELRTDITNAVLIGGDVQELYPIYNPTGGETIWPFWGLDPTSISDRTAIMGSGKPEVDHKVKLWAEEIADVIGDVWYPVDIPELRCAMIDFDSWATYVIRWNKTKATAINLVSAIDSTSDLASIFPDVMFNHDLIAERDEEANFLGGMNESDYWTNRANRVYDFVKRYADEYFGKKFLVRIPFLIFWKYEPDTTHLVSTDEISDAGYVSEGSMPLGLQYMNELTFLSQDGRFEAFVAVPNTGDIDIQSLDPDSCVVQSDAIYVKCTVDPQIVYTTRSAFPYCIVTLNSAVYKRAPDPLGGIDDIAQILNVPPDQVVSATALRHGSFPLKIHPAPVRPAAAAIPMKSNRMSYGPWGTFAPWGTIGVAGPVLFQRDEELVPWNYGGYDTMNQAAIAKLANAATNMQESEAGMTDLAESPRVQLGDSLIAGGPNVTGISVSVGAGGVSTSYSMQTFTPRFGVFTKDNADRLRRLGLAAQDMRRAIRALFQRRRHMQNVFMSARLGFMQNVSRAVQQSTPLNILYGTMSWSDRWGYRTQVSLGTPSEVFANVRPDKQSIWQASAAMGLEGLLRPFSTNTAPGASPGPADVPHFGLIHPDSGIDNSVPCRSTLDPFGDKHDIDIMIWGDKYPGHIHTKKAAPSQPQYSNSRLLGLRGPVIVVGWGYEYTGKPVPNDGDKTLYDDSGSPYPNLIQDWKDSFSKDFRTHPEKWKAGPIALHFDMWRKVWTIPTFLFGTLDTDIGDGGTATMTIYTQGAIDDKVKVVNWLGGGDPIKSGSKVIAGYNPFVNKWYIIAAACPQ